MSKVLAKGQSCMKYVRDAAENGLVICHTPYFVLQ